MRVYKATNIRRHVQYRVFVLFYSTAGSTAASASSFSSEGERCASFTSNSSSSSLIGEGGIPSAAVLAAAAQQQQQQQQSSVAAAAAAAAAGQQGSRDPTGRANSSEGGKYTLSQTSFQRQNIFPASSQGAPSVPGGGGGGGGGHSSSSNLTMLRVNYSFIDVEQRYGLAQVR